MKVLIVGSGGREHALAWKCAQSARVTEVLVAPGNAGTATEPKVRNVDVASEDIAGLVRLAQEEDVALTIIGLVFFYAVERLEALAIPWHVSHRVREDAGTM